MEAQATRRVLLQNRQLVTMREDLRLEATRAKRATKTGFI